jgi:hypothetical protein
MHGNIIEKINKASLCCKKKEECVETHSKIEYLVDT